jgi:hypothetical protein
MVYSCKWRRVTLPRHTGRRGTFLRAGPLAGRVQVFLVHVELPELVRVAGELGSLDEQRLELLPLPLRAHQHRHLLQLHAARSSLVRACEQRTTDNGLRERSD